ncbi:uncharacterized protein B0H64DRAFT_392954 [Chaetomium fimeti]|uniref:Gag1-like clamp domain-containing protein n=1 Tax=Chaetomium fimeti TaxID=1854472 RepID=A0AAE0HJS4_9PEZI|nr:hypothetical protein B0H64DRAFT_392954 [Chaetomium fimeti]
MHSVEDGPLISSGALEPSDKALIPVPSSPMVKRDGLDCGHGQNASNASIASSPAGCQCSQQPGHSSTVNPNSQAAPNLVGLDKPGLGKPGLLGEAIIPLPGLVAPHAQSQLQLPAQPIPIKAVTPEASRAPTGGDHLAPELSLHTTPSTMIFSDLYRSPRTTLTKFRNSFPQGVPPPPDIDADLVSKDKTRNREAVRKYLVEKIRNDWQFTWPPVATSEPTPTKTSAPDEVEGVQTTADVAPDSTPPLATADEETTRDPGEEADSESDAASVYSTISDDPGHFRPRAEWTSDLSDDDEPQPSASPFRFDSPEAVGAAVHDSIEKKRACRRRAVRDETKWNTGLACFEARRNAWTGAKTVRVKPKPASPVSPSSGRRLFWRHQKTQSSVSHSAIITSGSPPVPTSPISTTAPRSSTATTSDSDSGGAHRTISQDSNAVGVLYPVHTVVPVAPPLLPPQNAMRSSIQPSMYSSLYDRVVSQSQQPSCPVNLADMLRACVVGWKRDGEWPPKTLYPVPAPVPAANAEVIAMRQWKAQKQRNKNAAAGPTSGRRLSLVGLFGGSAGGANKTAATTAATTHEVKDTKEKDKENGLGHSQSHSHSDEGAGSSGKALFRRSLQKVLSLGQHGHAHSAANGNMGGPISPTTPSQKEATAAF